jgi:hypothetical protein
MGIIKTIVYALAALMAITFLSAIVGAFVFGMGAGISERADSQTTPNDLNVKESITLSSNGKEKAVKCKCLTVTGIGNIILIVNDDIEKITITGNGNAIGYPDTANPEIIDEGNNNAFCTVTMPDATPSAATPTPTVKVGTYENPAPLGKSFLSNTGSLRITVTEVERGNRVNGIIAAENMFNSEPAPGNEYMSVKIKFEYLKGDDKFPLSGYDFKAYSNDVECKAPILIMPDRYPEIGMIDLMPGGAIEKWKVYEVPKGEQVTIAYERLFVSAIYYFDAGSGNYP